MIIFKLSEYDIAGNLLDESRGISFQKSRRGKTNSLDVPGVG